MCSKVSLPSPVLPLPSSVLILVCPPLSWFWVIPVGQCGHGLSTECMTGSSHSSCHGWMNVWYGIEFIKQQNHDCVLFLAMIIYHGLSPWGAPQWFVVLGTWLVLGQTQLQWSCLMCWLLLLFYPWQSVSCPYTPEMSQFVDLVGIVLWLTCVPFGRGNISGCGVIPVDPAGQGCSCPNHAAAGLLKCSVMR